ncbi:MAG: DUF2061 domain-containing protein [Saprospiraceae bacterium]|nr:DUF2061 domain-containing protein [Saprospiraceae bacterium]
MKTNEDKVKKESHLRSLLKGITWRVIATSTTVAIAWLITGQIEDALKIGGIEFIGKILIYYLHERAWQILPLGSVRRLVGNE